MPVMELMFCATVSVALAPSDVDAATDPMVEVISSVEANARPERSLSNAATWSTCSISALVV